MQCFMYNARPLELRGRPRLHLEAFTVFQVGRAQDGASVWVKFGRETLIHTERRFAELVSTLVPVEFLLNQEPDDEGLKAARKSVERQILSWRCEEIGLSREIGALLLALVDTGKLERATVDALLQRVDDECGWTFDRLYYLALGQFASNTKGEVDLQGGAVAG